jgi:hypothetical protein
MSQFWRSYRPVREEFVFVSYRTCRRLEVLLTAIGITSVSGSGMYVDNELFHC